MLIIVEMKWYLLYKKKSKENYDNFVWVDSTKINIKEFNYKENTYQKELTSIIEGLKEQVIDSYNKIEKNVQENADLKEMIKKKDNKINELNKYIESLENKKK